jgi:hypothetical protein
VLSAVTSLSAKPMFVKMRTASGAAEILKTSIGPVVVPLEVPLMLTLTPANGAPVASVTLPVTSRCALAEKKAISVVARSRMSFFI